MEKICGVDVHRDLLVVTILSNETNETRNFENSSDDIEKLKDWLKIHECKRAVMESTSIYWVPLYLGLERELTRLRVKYVQNRTAFKNRCQKVLNRVNIRLRCKLTDVFGKAGMEILNGLMAGKTIEDILEHTESKRLKSRCEEIKTVAKGALSENDIFVLKHLTETINHLNEQIRDLEAIIETFANKHDVEIVSSVPGVGSRSAAAILAEIGDAKRFSNGKQIASWTGLLLLFINRLAFAFWVLLLKQGSKWLRWSMVEVAHAAVRVRDSRFRALFLRVIAKKGKKTAYIAVARKMLTVIWHLLVNGEKYVEGGFQKKVRLGKVAYGGHVPLEAMAEVLRTAGYTVVANG